ncbi:hypothetical protein EYF80_031459 [Liparis tanakae]|uniref:Uncharacterized protein n=1 Tax=Liparis tanakae TaxID=230148 RepID=A0A4Z2GXG1_9TELE|nr:hypothetical protein EYF80_031459 [Liparis tanakae]
MRCRGQRSWVYLHMTADLVTLMRISPGGPESPSRPGPGSSSVWGMCWAACGPPSVTWSYRVLCRLQAPAELHADTARCSPGEQRGRRGAPGGVRDEGPLGITRKERRVLSSLVGWGSERRTEGSQFDPGCA